MSVDWKKRREYDERVQAIIELLDTAQNLSKTMCQDVGRGGVGYNQLFNTLYSLWYCKKRMENLLNIKNRYDTK